MNYVDHLNLFGVEAKQIPCSTGAGAPTTSTEGAVGCLYMDTDTGDIYKCVGVTNGMYEWFNIASSRSVSENSNDLPRIFLTGEMPNTKADGEYKLRVSYKSQSKNVDCFATAKVQGSSSTTFAKKNYTFKLYSDEACTEKLKIRFRNWGEQSKFVAKANTIDRTHARNVVSCRIWNDLVNSRTNYEQLPLALRNSPNNGAIDGFPVQMYLNGIYLGLYTWNIPKDTWMTAMSDDAEHHDIDAIICGYGATNNATGQNGGIQCSFNEAYANDAMVISGYDWKDELDTVGSTTRANFRRAVDLIVNGSDEEFRSGISTYFDMESLYDTYLFYYLSCAVDNLGKNQLLLTYNSGLPWYASVYDLDSTWGGTPEGTKIVSHETAMQDDYWYPKNHGLKNRLYDRLEKLFKDDIKKRWNAVKYGPLSLSNIINHFEAFHDVIPIELFAEDSAVTTADGRFAVTVDANNKGFDAVLDVDQNNLQQIRNFAAKRWVYMDAKINEVKCDGVTLSESIVNLTAEKSTVALIATVSPSDCTDAMIWSSDDETVAVVMGGTVTACNNGTTRITVVCGDYSATCQVTVSGLDSGASVNLADITSTDWINGAELSGNGVAESPRCCVTNYIHVKLGDVLVVSGCSPIYAANGYARHNAYTMDKQLLSDKHIFMSTLKDNGLVNITSDGGSITFSRDYMLNRGYPEEMYVRLTLKALDGESEVNLDNVCIYRNPNGENAEAWT